MEINIINKDELRNFFKTFGLYSCTCYNTDKKFAIGVGKSCLKTGHFSGSRAVYITFEFSGVSRACLDQMARHSIGTSINMQSGRYVSLENFEYHTPTLILKNDIAKEIYDKHMEETRKNYKLIVQELEKCGYTGEKVFECARGIAPMNHHSKMTMGFTIEALINFMNKRLCVCSQEEIRKVAALMKKQVIDIIPELDEYLVAACDENLYCKEKPSRSCGKYPQKDVIKDIIKNYKGNKHE